MTVKTLIRSCVNNYKPSQVELSLIDPKGDYRSLSKLPNFGDRYYNIGMKDRWLEVLQKTEKLIYDRINKIESSEVGTMDVKAFNKKYPEQAIPRHVLIIDECHNVMLTDDKPNREEISCIKKISREGRALGVHLVLSTQRPSRTVIDGDIKANFPAVLGLRVDNDINSRIIIGENGLEKLTGNGDAIFKNGDGRLIRMQVAIFEDDLI